LYKEGGSCPKPVDGRVVFKYMGPRPGTDDKMVAVCYNPMLYVDTNWNGERILKCHRPEDIKKAAFDLGFIL
jgi:hypothetical protein